MKVSDAIVVIRKNVKDDVAPYKHTDSDVMIPAINAALDQLWKKRRTAYFGISIITLKPSALTATTQDLPVTDDYTEAVILYASYRILNFNATDRASTAAAQTFRQMFMAEIEG